MVKLRRLRREPPRSAFAVLLRLFVGRVFSGDSGEQAADPQTSAVRALAAVATPMLMVAFWVVLLSPRHIDPWASAATHYVFVLYAFVSIGCVALTQWENLFPAREDFLILLPLPLKPRTLFTARLSAVAVLLGMFLAAANVFGTFLLPVLAGSRILPAMAAHAVAVFCAGASAGIATVAMEALLVAVMPERWLARIAPVLQAVGLAALLLLFCRMDVVSDHLPALLSGAIPAMRWFPPLWYLALYECMLGGATATAFAHGLARYAVLSLPVAALALALTYPAAWTRRRRAALESAPVPRGAGTQPLQAILHSTLLRRADSRAVFHFIQQTITRLAQYHLYLTMYCGAGIALCAAVAVKPAITSGRLVVSLSPAGMRAVLPILLFWMIAGLRGAFLLPADLRARWIFQMAPLKTQRVTSTAKLWVACFCGLATLLVLAVFYPLGVHRQELVLQLVFGVLMTLLLTDLFFFLEASVPFTRPRLPGRSSLPLTLATYIFGVPLFTLCAVLLEGYVSGHAWRIAGAICCVAGGHALLGWLRSLPSHPASDDAFLDESADDFIQMNLSGT